MKRWLTMAAITTVALSMTCYLGGCATDAPTDNTQTDTPQTEQPKNSDAHKAEVELSDNSVLTYFDDEGLKQLVADMKEGKTPTSCNVLYDQMGSLPDVTVTDADTIGLIYKAVAGIEVVSPSGMSITDSYHHVYFELQDGTKTGFSFEGAGNLVRKDANYAVTGDAELWAIVRALQNNQSADTTDVTDVTDHAIVVKSGEEYIESVPTSAKTGETVLIRTFDVTDVVMNVSVTGAEVARTPVGYAFVMPDHEADVYITLSAAWGDV